MRHQERKPLRCFVKLLLCMSREVPQSTVMWTIWSDLISDMVADAERKLETDNITDREHPQWKAYEALLSVQNNYR